MIPKGWTEEQFVPLTRAISIGGGVLYRPLRSWHSGTYAGERLRIVNGDRSGCVREVALDGYSFPQQLAFPPYTVTTRLYWNADVPGRDAVAYLSYPRGMGAVDRYFWQAHLEEAVRFLSEEECEEAIRKYLSTEQVPEDRRAS